MDRNSLRVLAGLLVLVVGAGAQAYPHYIATGHAQCSGCHFSPTGGGLPTSMGTGAVEAVFPDLWGASWLESLRAKVSRDDPTGVRDDQPAPQVAVGLDARLLFVRSVEEVGDSPQWNLVPMLLEPTAVAAFGPWLLYAGIAPRRRSTDEHALTVVSREHWVSYAFDESHQLRAGRMVLPFGLRVPDHTLYTREDFALGRYDQSYAVAYDHDASAYELHAAAFLGDLGSKPPALLERGVALSASLTLWDDRLSLGASVLAGATQATLRPAASIFVRVRPAGASYLVGELSAQRKLFGLLAPGGARGGQSSAAGFLRVGWFPHPSTDLYAELAGRALEGGREHIKLRYQLGLSSHLLPWVELAPALVLEEDVETGLKTSVMGQLHIIY